MAENPIPQNPINRIVKHTSKINRTVELWLRKIRTWNNLLSFWLSRNKRSPDFRMIVSILMHLSVNSTKYLYLFLFSIALIISALNLGNPTDEIKWKMQLSYNWLLFGMVCLPKCWRTFKSTLYLVIFNGFGLTVLLYLCCTHLKWRRHLHRWKCLVY